MTIVPHDNFQFIIIPKIDYEKIRYSTNVPNE